MDKDEFSRLDRRYRLEKPKLFLRHSSSKPASESEIYEVEFALGIKLSEDFVWFLKNYGGGDFGYLTVFSAIPGDEWNLVVQLSNASNFMPEFFLPICDDFAGGFYGFMVSDDIASPQIHYWNTDGGVQPTAFANVLDFIGRYAYEPA